MILNLLAILFITLTVYISHLFHLTFLIPFFAGSMIVLGLLFFLGTTVGLIRFPDFYTRMHAAGKGDTLSSMLILLGCAILALDNGHLDYAVVLVGIKVLIIMNFIFIGSPTATHAMMDAGYETGVKHWVKEKVENNENKGKK